jgi:hypothetical protein
VSFTNASVIDLRLRLHDHCHAHNEPDIDDVSVTTLHSLALRLLRQGLFQAYPTRPLVLDSWELENIYDAELVARKAWAARAEGRDSALLRGTLQYGARQRANVRSSGPFHLERRATAFQLIPSAYREGL